MVGKVKAGLAFAAAFAFQAPLRAQESVQQDKMQSDAMKQDRMKQDDKMADKKKKSKKDNKKWTTRWRTRRTRAEKAARLPGAALLQAAPFVVCRACLTVWEVQILFTT